SYFSKKAEEYDLVDNQLYWKLSDTLLWDILKNNVLYKLNDNFSFIDVGGGTGRWSIKVLENFRLSEGVIFDLSKEMLNQARMKLKGNNSLTERCEIIEGDIDSYTDISSRFDLAFTFHNVLGFVNDPFSVLEKMTSMVKKGGYVVAVVPNFYHNIFFNVSTGNVKLANETITTKKGRFTENMPNMHMFTPEYLKDTFEKIGLETLGVYGFPISIYPGFQETQLQGQSMHLQEILKDESNFKEILNFELELYKNS